MTLLINIFRNIRIGTEIVLVFHSYTYLNCSVVIYPDLSHAML